MEKNIKDLQKTLDTILTNLNKQKEENENTINIKLLKTLINTSKKYNSYEMKTSYGMRNTKDKFDCLYNIIVEQNNRINKLEEKLNVK